MVYKWFLFFLLLLKCNANKINNNNILLILVDDLRPALGCYGDLNAYTPNIDKLAEKSVVFTRAYAQQALCAPSRNSLLTSRRPDTLHLYDFYSYWRDNNKNNYTTLPHSNYSDDSPYSWTDVPFHPVTDKYKNTRVCFNNNASELARNLVCPVNVTSMPRFTLPDLENLNAAKQYLSNYSKLKPFFLAVGFEKPHIPLKYPEEYLKFHPLMILTSDHGWSLGEHSLWAKYSNFDVAVRVPLIVSIPKKTKSQVYVKSIVELVDLFPTIAELIKLPIDVCGKVYSSTTCSEGISFLPVISAYKNKIIIRWKKAAFSQYPRPGLTPTWKPNSDEPKLNKIKIMGYTLRTERYRYTVWIPFNYNTSNWKSIISQELYDHKNDPDEMINQQSNNYYLKIKSKLFKLLKSGWRKALP
ncbi:GSCOCG00010330001-RA-CDS [Cotesia congregata]|nr:GSCOCG00010330001-RA-CDS [Cotesia congregata]